MKCAFCEKHFDEEAARQACQSCSSHGGCRKVKCPHCGMEAPAEPASVKWVRKLINRMTKETT